MREHLYGSVHGWAFARRCRIRVFDTFTGSKDLTSDLDVNIECNRGDFITAAFNKKFEEVWGQPRQTCSTPTSMRSGKDDNTTS